MAINPFDDLTEEEQQEFLLQQAAEPELGELPPLSRTAPPALSFDNFTGLGINMRLPRELMDRLSPLMEMLNKENELREAGFGELSQYQSGLQADARMARNRQTMEQRKPLPVNAAMIGLNKAAGELADILSPKRGFREQAQEREALEIGEAKARRLERLKMLESDAQQAMERARQMGDQLAFKKAFNEAEKFATLRQGIAGTMKDFWAARDKAAQAYQNYVGQLDLVRAKYNSQSVAGLGRIPAAMKVRLDSHDMAFQQDWDVLKQELNSIEQNMLGGKTEEINDAKQKVLEKMTQRQQQYFMEREEMLSGLRTLVTDPAGKPKPFSGDVQSLGHRVVRDVANRIQLTNTSALVNELEGEFRDPESVIYKQLGVEPGTPEAAQIRNEALAEARKTMPKVERLHKKIAELKSKLIDLDYSAQQSGDPHLFRAKNRALYRKYNEEYQAKLKALRNSGFQVFDERLSPLNLPPVIVQ